MISVRFRPDITNERIHMRLSLRIVVCDLTGNVSSSSPDVWVPFLVQFSFVNLFLKGFCHFQHFELFGAEPPCLLYVGNLRVVTVTSSVTSVFPSSSPLNPAPDSETNQILQRLRFCSCLICFVYIFGMEHFFRVH